MSEELEQWFTFCDKLDNYINELNSEKTSYNYKHILPNKIYWPILEYTLICDYLDYHYRYMFNIDDYEYVRQFTDDDGCMKEMITRVNNRGEGEII